MSCDRRDPPPRQGDLRQGPARSGDEAHQLGGELRRGPHQPVRLRQGARSQDLPRPLVVHARRGRPLQLHRHPAERHLPDLLLPGLDGRGHLRGLVRRPQGDRHVGGHGVDARHQLRHPRRTADAPDPPLGGPAVRGVDRAAHAPRLLHRRLPQAARDQLDRRLPAVRPRDGSRVSPATRFPTTCSPATASASSTD